MRWLSLSIRLNCIMKRSSSLRASRGFLSLSYCRRSFISASVGKNRIKHSTKSTRIVRRSKLQKHKTTERYYYCNNCCVKTVVITVVITIVTLRVTVIIPKLIFWLFLLFLPEDVFFFFPSCKNVCVVLAIFCLAFIPVLLEHTCGLPDRWCPIPGQPFAEWLPGFWLCWLQARRLWMDLSEEVSVWIESSPLLDPEL